ncbi:hypothetical protein RDI58_004279 [Solanum bulbocastanum]|uniref:Response regulatory domain-containing protein n=1 Tax=Solanum bulbocastanum TaxID=147425 RepID=A0AAN8TXH0_SOLBU
MDAPYYGMIEEVWVMLIDDDKEFVTKMTDMLKSQNYKVIAVDTTSTTMPILFEGKQKIDVMIVNVNLSNLLFVDLLAQAEALNIISLGCFPKEIVEVMSLPGLTRMQVASHLQKCRRNNWRSPKERKYIRHLSIKRSKNVPHETKSSFQKFGVMPYLQANVPNQQWNADQIQRGTKFSFPTHNTKNTFARGETSIQQLYHPQFQGATYSGSRIVSSTYIGNAIINNYNLNVIPDNVTTYSSGAMMSDTYVENVTINGLGATNTNANSQQYVGEPIMSGPRSIFVASYENYVVWSNSNEKDNFDAYLNFNNMNYLFQNLGPPSANLPNEKGNEFDQVYFDDQNLGPPGANLPNQQDNEFDQVYYDDQVSSVRILFIFLLFILS